MNSANRIETNPEIMLGKPIIRGTRITVSFILDALVTMSIEELMAAYPFLTKEDIEAALKYAARVIDSQRGNDVEVLA